MKKLFIVLIALLCLTACATSKGYSKLSDGDDVIISGPNDYSFSKQDLYETLKPVSQSAIENSIYKRLIDILEIDLTDAKAKVEDTIELYKSIGYISEEDVEMYRNYFMQQSIFDELSKNYINVNYDKFVEEDKPVKMEFASFDSEDAANKLIEDVKAGENFATAASNNGYTGQVVSQVYIDSDSLPINVKSYLNSTASTGLSTIIISSDSTTDADGNIQTTDTYYVLNIDSKEVNDFKEEYIQKKVDSIGVDGVKDYLFSTHEYKFYDQDIYEIMKAQYEVLK